jgi:hypothetical protein
MRKPTGTDGAADALATLGDRAEIVMLTAMPHKHRALRRAHLDALGLTYPLLTTEMAKGPAWPSCVATRAGPSPLSTNQPNNLSSTRYSVADAHLFHLMADNSLRAILPPMPDDIAVVEDWREAAPKIAATLGL